MGESHGVAGGTYGDGSRLPLGNLGRCVDMCEGVKGRGYGDEGVYNIICELGGVTWGVRCGYERWYTQG